jgi:hypothetical protein
MSLHIKLLPLKRTTNMCMYVLIGILFPLISGDTSKSDRGKVHTTLSILSVCTK